MKIYVHDIYSRFRSTDPAILHIRSTSGLSFLMHDVMTLSDATLSYMIS